MQRVCARARVPEHTCMHAYTHTSTLAGIAKQARAEQSKSNPHATTIDQKIGRRLSAKSAFKEQVGVAPASRGQWVRMHACLPAWGRLPAALVCSPACAALRVQRQGGQAPCIAQAWCPPSLRRARRGLQTSRPSVRLPRRGAASGMEEGWMVVMMMRRRGATARMRRCQVWGWGVAAVRRKSARALARGQVCVAGPAD